MKHCKPRRTTVNKNSVAIVVTALAPTRRQRQYRHTLLCQHKWQYELGIKEQKSIQGKGASASHARGSRAFFGTYKAPAGAKQSTSALNIGECWQVAGRSGNRKGCCCLGAGACQRQLESHFWMLSQPPMPLAPCVAVSTRVSREVD